MSMLTCVSRKLKERERVMINDLHAAQKSAIDRLKSSPIHCG